MKKIFVYVVALASAIILMTACKTTEENYRKAYDKAVSQRDSDIAFEESVYGSVRRQMRGSFVVVDGDSVEVKTQHITVTEGQPAATKIGAFNVVVGQFKQVFNARSLCKRLQANGLAGAFIVNTREPYYYVIGASAENAKDAVAEMQRIESSGVVTMRDPLPFLLSPAGRR